MKLSNYVACKDILGVRTNVKQIGWSFGQPSEAASDEESNRCRLVIKCTVDPLEVEASEFNNLQKYHYWRGEDGRDELFYQRNLFAGSKLRLLLRGIGSGQPEIIANRNYCRFVVGRFINLHSLGYHLTDLACAMLLRKDLCPLHCSSFSTGDSTVVIVAPGNTGKTLATMRAVLHLGASFVAEDLAITDGQFIYGCPWTSTFRYYDELSMSWLLRMRMKLIKAIPPVELIRMCSDDRKIDAYIDKKRIVTRKRITHVAILARRSGGVEVLDKERARQMVLNLNRYEFAYMKNPMLTAYSYFNPEFDIQALEGRERDILAKLVDGATCLLVHSEDPTVFSDLILKRMGSS
jgi:hypothetical protein